MVAMDIRDRLDTIPGGFEEVSEVVDQRSVFVRGFECTAWQWVIFKVVDSLASNPSAVDEQTALGTFEQDPIVTVMSDFDFGSISEFGAEEKLRRGVVSARIGGKPVAELDWMFDHLGQDFDGSGVGFSHSPGCDIDVMGSPIGQFPARILVPPSEFVVAARPAFRLAVIPG